MSRLQVRGTLGVGLTIRLPRGISVSYITKNPINYFCDSPIRIHFLVLPGIINSSASRSTNLCITKTSVTYGRIYAYPLKHPFVTAYGGSAKSNTNLYKVIRPIAIVLSHKFQPHTVPVFRHITYLHTSSSPRILSRFHPTLPELKITHFSFPQV